MRKDENYNFSPSQFGIMKSIASWQQSATAWTELYKEFAAHSQEMTDALWRTWTSKQSLQSRENMSFLVVAERL
jgi:hypothetical protein